MFITIPFNVFRLGLDAKFKLVYGLMAYHNISDVNTISASFMGRELTVKKSTIIRGIDKLHSIGVVSRHSIEGDLITYSIPSGSINATITVDKRTATGVSKFCTRFISEWNKTHWQRRKCTDVLTGKLNAILNTNQWSEDDIIEVMKYRAFYVANDEWWRHKDRERARNSIDNLIGSVSRFEKWSARLNEAPAEASYIDEANNTRLFQGSKEDRSLLS